MTFDPRQSLSLSLSPLSISRPHIHRDPDGGRRCRSDRARDKTWYWLLTAETLLPSHRCGNCHHRVHLTLTPSLSFCFPLSHSLSPSPSDAHLTIVFTPHNVNHENHTRQHLSKRKSAMFVYNLTKVCPPLERLSRHPLERPPTPPPPSASTCSPGDRYYLHGRGSGVNAVSKAPGSWQVKIKCLEIEM